MKNVSLRFGDQVMLDDFSYEFCRGDKIGIVGRNGVGKVGASKDCSISILRLSHKSILVDAFSPHSST